MIIEEQGESGGVVDSLNSTYHNLAGRSLETGYMHEGPGDGHAGRVHYTDPNLTHREAVDKLGQHIRDHGGEDIQGYVPRNNFGDGEPTRSLILFKDGGQRRVAHIQSHNGQHTMKFEA